VAPAFFVDAIGHQHEALLDPSLGLDLEGEAIQEQVDPVIAQGAAEIGSHLAIEGPADIRDGGGADPFTQDRLKHLAHSPGAHPGQEGLAYQLVEVALTVAEALEQGGAVRGPACSGHAQALDQPQFPEDGALVIAITPAPPAGTALVATRA
jgi:hypothetical protein